MKLYAWAGQQAAALRQYEEGVRLLDEELGVTPEAETTALFEAIKTKRLPPPTAAAEPVSEASETEESSVFPPSQRSLPSIPRHNLPPLIGRAPQLATLDNLLTQVGQGSGQVVLVGGEAGIGKSRLVIEARRRADQQGWQTVQGDCFEPDVLFPYAPLIDLLRTSLTHRSVKEVTTLLGPLASEVVKLLPELALTLPELTPTPLLDPEAEKRRLFETFVQFFLNLMQQDTEKDQHSGKSAGRIRPDSPPFPHPLLIIIEDLHWSDDTSLELLRYLARRLATQPLLLLLTYRSDELNPSLQHFLAALSREQRPVELTLPRFTLSEVDAFLRAIFEHERPMRAEFLDALYNLTAGNPFFIEEVLKALMAAGDVFYSDGVWDRKPIDEPWPR
jgi:hypothetical protein